RNLVALTVANAKEEADAKAYALTVMMQAVAGVDPQIVQALTNVHMAPEQLIAQAFYELGRGAEKIGQLNVSPELLTELLGRTNTQPTNRVRSPNPAQK
ncbi:hypothetical protein TI04_10945, partial [Achromatium sp. WMS2]